MEENVCALMRELKSLGIYAQLEDNLNPYAPALRYAQRSSAGASGERLMKRICAFVESDLPTKSCKKTVDLPVVNGIGNKNRITVTRLEFVFIITENITASVGTKSQLLIAGRNIYIR